MINAISFSKRKTTIGAIILFFTHVLIFFFTSMGLLVLLDRVYPSFNETITPEEMGNVIRYTIQIVGTVYALVAAYFASKTFDKGPKLFALVFSTGSAFLLNGFMGLLLPVMMTTMIEESE
jgi:predicted phage tail protein